MSILIIPLIVMPVLESVFFTITLQRGYGQNEMNNWQTYVDPDKRFTLFYPPGWTAEGKENFLSSIDLTDQSKFYKAFPSYYYVFCE
ncbi:MAG: hypothetical protein WBX29_09645 [Nitrososphaeraceae archaeon]